MNPIDSRHWQIGQVIFDYARRELRVGQHSAYLEPKLFTLLLLFVQSAQHQVSRDQLIAEVWSGRVVSESAINRAISLLRKAFHLLDPETDYIETLPKVGYRLMVPVQLIVTEKPNQSPTGQFSTKPIVNSAVFSSTTPNKASASALQSDAQSNAQIEAQPPAQHQKELTAQTSALVQQQMASTIEQEMANASNSTHALRALVASRWFWAGLLMLLIFMLAWNFRSYWSSPHWLETQHRPVYLTYEAGSETSVSANSTHLFYQRKIAGAATELWLKPLHDKNAAAVRIPVRSIHDAAERTGSEVALVANGRLSSASLSPDGQWLLFAEYQAQQCQVFLLSVKAQQMRSLFDCPFDSHFEASWQADSQAFFYRQRQNKTKPYALYSYSLATTKQQQLTAPASDDLAGSLLLAASPQVVGDEQAAAVAILRYLDPKHTELLLLRGPSWQPQKVATLTLNISSMQWLRHDLLLFSAGEQIYQYHLPSHRLHPLHTAREDIDSFQASHDRLWIAEQRIQSSIRRFSPRNDDSERLIEFEGANVMPRVRSSDQTLFFLSDIGGHFQIWQQQVGEQPKMLSELPHPSFTRMSLSSDQQSLVFSQLGAIYQLNIANGSTVQLLGPEFKANVVNLDNSSNRLVFSSDRSGDWQLWQFDLEQKKLHQLTKDGGYSGYLADNTLYFSRYHQPGLWRKTLPDGDAELLIPDLDVVNWLNWHIDAQQIYFYRPTSGVWRYEISSKQQQQLMPLRDNFVHQFQVSGEAIYFVERRPSEGNIAQLQLSTLP
jgi:DNA-binding winged helix-turn-helix (wHTH) protein/Tol biopolymer transport system component